MGTKKPEPRPSGLARLRAQTDEILAPEARLPDVPVQQSTTLSMTASAYARDPAHDQRVTDAIIAGASNAEINAIITTVAAERAANPEPIVGPPGEYNDPVQPPVQRSLVSASPAAAFNADSDVAKERASRIEDTRRLRSAPPSGLTAKSRDEA